MSEVDGLSIYEVDLPATVRTEEHILALYEPSKNLSDSLNADLCIKRIEDVFEHLWAVGRPLPPRALNLQLVLNRSIVPTTETSLHLVCTSGRIFVRVLPAYFISTGFHEQFLRGNKPHRLALGLLHSYLALIPTELNFLLAQERHLIPPKLVWEEWRALARRVPESYPHNEIYEHLPLRYVYGELRLGRLDIIYRLKGHWMDGYSTLTRPQIYSEFITRHLVSIATGTGYLIIVLTAMQLGLSTVAGALIPNAAFLKVCYGFAAFAMLAPLLAAGAIFLAALIMFFVNWSITVRKSDQRFKQLGREAPSCLRVHPRNRKKAEVA